MNIFLVRVLLFACRWRYGAPRLVINAFKNAAFSPDVHAKFIQQRSRLKELKCGWMWAEIHLWQFCIICLFFGYFLMWGENLHDLIVDLDKKHMSVYFLWTEPLPFAAKGQFELRSFTIVCTLYRHFNEKKKNNNKKLRNLVHYCSLFFSVLAMFYF